ncbi:MAG: hypothetical protein HY283_09750 [Nitrospirae bacterium]|nr:hypothetical protein [Nitrospirota bacterium]
MQKPADPSLSEDRAVLHLRAGKLLKGLLSGFTPTADTVRLQFETEPAKAAIEVKVSDLKAIYYVRSLSGNKQYKKKRYFGSIETKGKRIMVRFKDGEILCGFIEGELPWKDGFLTLSDPDLKGFFIFPADPESNNTKVFVVTTAVEDVRRL